METTNSEWLQKQNDVIESHSKLEMLLKVREDLLWKQRIELEGLTVYWNGYWAKAFSIGLKIKTPYELHQVEQSGILWPRSKQINHQCNSIDCNIYNIPKGTRVPTQQPDKEEFITVSGEWYLCMDTGKLHRCPPNERCNALRVTKDPVHGITMAHTCVISNMVKPKPTSKRPEWDGTTFYSKDTLRDLDMVQDDAEKSEVEDQSEEMVQEGGVSEDESDEELPMIKRPRGNDQLPYSAMQVEFGEYVFDDLVRVVAEKRHKEEQELMRKQREEYLNQKHSMSFAPSTGDRKQQRWFNQIRNSTSLWKEKEKGRVNQQKRRSERRETIIRSAEQKSERCLGKADEKLVFELIEAITAANVVDNIVRCKLHESIGAADQAVYSLKRKYSEVPLSIQIGVWCQSVNASIALPLKSAGDRVFDTKECVRIVMCHWKLASFSPYVTDTLDIHKKKKRKPLDFLLFSLGILYLMAQGGETVNLQVNIPIPSILRKKFPKAIARIEHGFTVKELPDCSASWGKWVLASDMLPYIQRVYRDDWIFNCRTVADGKQLVKTCNTSRYRHAENQLGLKLKSLEANVEQHTDSELQTQLEQYYKQYLRELIPAHSSSRQWPTSISSTTNSPSTLKK